MINIFFFNGTISVIIKCWLLITTLIWIAWAIRPTRYFDKCEWNRDSGLKRVAAKVIGGSGFIGITSMLWTGCDSLLSFIPATLKIAFNYDEDPAAVGSTLSGFIALFIAIVFAVLLLGYEKERRSSIDAERENKRQNETEGKNK